LRPQTPLSAPKAYRRMAICQGPWGYAGALASILEAGHFLRIFEFLGRQKVGGEVFSLRKKPLGRPKCKYPQNTEKFSLLVASSGRSPTETQ
jgi:hypothetical protein